MARRYSNSYLEAHQKCPLRAHYSYDLKLHAREGDQHHFVFGRACHEAWRVLYKEGDIKQAQSVMRTLYPVQLDPEDKGKTADNACFAIECYVKEYNWDKGWKILAMEEMDVGEDDYVVKLDMVVEDVRTGDILGVDHKFAQPLYSKILTPKGWATMGETKVGSEILGRDGRVNKVLGVYPQGKVACYEITFSDGSKVQCSDNHLWNIMQEHSDKEVTLPLSEIRKKLKKKTLDKRSGISYSYRFRVPLVDPVPLPKKFLSIHPYVLGALLGDGSFRANSPQIAIGSQDAGEMFTNLQEHLPEAIKLRKVQSSNCSWYLSGGRSGGKKNELMVQLINLELWGKKSEDKFVPVDYLNSGFVQRLALLEGLLDTDGCCYKGFIYFDNVSLQLARDVVYLVRSLGGFAKLNKRSGTKAQAYRVNIRFDNGIVPFRLTRKRSKGRKLICKTGKRIVSVDLVGMEEMQCIKTSAQDQLYVTDDFTVTHNTGSYLNADFFNQFNPNSQVTQYYKYIVEKYGRCDGFIIDAVSLRHRSKASTYQGVKQLAGPWCAFERLTVNRSPQQILQDTISRDDTIADIERCKELGRWRMHTVSCRFCPFRSICAAGWDWENDSELILANWRQVCDKWVHEKGFHCQLDAGHDGEHSPEAPDVENVEFEVEL